MADDEVLGGFVIDNGASWTRGGFSGDPSPRAVFPTLVGRLRPNATSLAEELGLNDICKRPYNVLIAATNEICDPDPILHFPGVGDQALSKRGQYDLGSPISRGIYLTLY